ncbi:uncharacterized protein LOC134534727 isoform X1 [Bacillus rossius redtenbacheri]|uniref:uncharacterized protein LOC134534727 isoform X1 n=1 Tax=Bacillus rossius redtenbacheri TaxID=93214 RepID=UPI002FDCA253
MESARKQVLNEDKRRGKKRHLRLNAVRKKRKWNKGKVLRLVDGRLRYVKNHETRFSNYTSHESFSTSKHAGNIENAVERKTQTDSETCYITLSPARCSTSPGDTASHDQVDIDGAGCSFWTNEILATPQKVTTTDYPTEEYDVTGIFSDTEQESKSVTSDYAQLLEGVEKLSSPASSPEQTSPKKTFSSESSTFPIQGRRLFDVDFLFKEMSRISQHNKVFQCSFENMRLIKEHKNGMISKFDFKCNMCGTVESIFSEDPQTNKVNCNMAWVNSMLLTGQSFTQLQDITSTLEMPCMAKETFNKCQKSLSSVIHDVACQSMEAAGKEEARLAVENGSVDVDGVPLIAVVTDGAWCKRSYGNKYDALSGVACIVGKETKKVIFASTRNRYCCICSRANSKNETPKDHVCFKNWNKSSNAMESDIIVEGFKCSVSMHNLKYHQLIGDGDSSIMTQLVKAQPYGPNFTITKIECTNHILRNYLRRIRCIAQKTKNEIGSVSPVLRKAVSDKQLRLRAAVTGAVQHRRAQKEFPIHRKIEELKLDIYNGPFHVFGDHSGCAIRGYFCSGLKENEENLVPPLQEAGIWSEIIAARNIVAHHAVSLLHNVNTNTAESFNNVVCKHVSSKRVNFCLSGGYQTRSELSVISFNSGPQTQSFIHKGNITKAHIQRKERSSEKRKLRRLTNPQTFKRRKLYVTGPDKDYGCVEQRIPDMEPDEYARQTQEFLASLCKTDEERENLQIATKGQNDSVLWKSERIKRLTASNFGRICNMKKSTKRAKSVVNILYSRFSGTEATRYGLENEHSAIQDFEVNFGKKVARCGLFVDKEHPWLAATPDGLVGDDGILEVKCPAVAARMSPQEAVEQKKVTFCNILDGKMFLKKGHAYMYQVQGQLHITNRKYCYFVLWTPRGLLVQQIERENSFWKEKMINKLTQFYMTCLLPEIIDPRYPRNMEIREPDNTL